MSMLVPRDYQLEARDAICGDAISASPPRDLIINLPTGTGKTLI